MIIYGENNFIACKDEINVVEFKHEDIPDGTVNIPGIVYEEDIDFKDESKEIRSEIKIEEMEINL